MSPNGHQETRLALMAVLTLAVQACSGKGGDGLPSARLDQAIGGTIGDPTTCVLVADAHSGKELYRYGAAFNCQRGLPACDRPGILSARAAIPLAAVQGGRAASCASNADASRTVGWAEGQVKSAKRALIYSAVMEGETALPGQEMSARLDEAFSQSGL